MSRRSITEQTFNLRVLVGKYVEHHELFHNFIDFNRAVDRVWHDGLWRVLKVYNIYSRLIEVIRSFEATSAVLVNESVGDFFRTTVGVQQGCTLSPVIFRIFGKANAEDFETSAAIR